MPEIFIFIYGNRFLMNKIIMKLLLMKNPSSNEEIWIVTS